MFISNNLATLIVGFVLYAHGASSAHAVPFIDLNEFNTGPPVSIDIFVSNFDDISFFDLENVAVTPPELTSNQETILILSVNLSDPILDAMIGILLTTVDGESAEAVFQFNSAGIITSVPEPSSLLFMGLGLAGLGFIRKRKAA